MGLLSSSRIYRYSLDVFDDHRKLVIFPLLTVGVWVTLLALFLLPESRTLSVTREAVDPPILTLAGIWLTGMFITTIINTAFYSQALSAMNGGSVSIKGGFAIAFEKLPAIAGWALFASTVGLILTVIERWLSLAGHLVGALLGVSWMAASQFVVPIMLKEPRPQTPLEYLRISSRVMKSFWADGMSFGSVGPGYAAGIWVMCVVTVTALVTLITHMRAPLLVGLLVLLCILVWQGAATVIFRCGLYIFATEGVAPGHFDRDAFNRTWEVR